MKKDKYLDSEEQKLIGSLEKEGWESMFHPYY